MVYCNLFLQGRCSKIPETNSRFVFVSLFVQMYWNSLMLYISIGNNNMILLIYLSIPLLAVYNNSFSELLLLLEGGGYVKSRKRFQRLFFSIHGSSSGSNTKTMTDPLWRPSFFSNVSSPYNININTETFNLNPDLLLMYTPTAMPQ